MNFDFSILVVVAAILGSLFVNTVIPMIFKAIVKKARALNARKNTQLSLYVQLEDVIYKVAFVNCYHVKNTARYTYDLVESASFCPISQTWDYTKGRGVARRLNIDPLHNSIMSVLGASYAHDNLSIMIHNLNILERQERGRSFFFVFNLVRSPLFLGSDRPAKASETAPRGEQPPRRAGLVIRAGRAYNVISYKLLHFRKGAFIDV